MEAIPSILAPFFYARITGTETMNRIDRPLKIKQMTETGVFEGYGSVFGVEDSWHDIIEKGAFTESLKRWEEKGSLPALLWQHSHSKPIGVYEEMKEDENGLYVRGRLLVDDVSLAKEAWALLKAGAVTGLSIGCRVKKEEYDATDKVSRIKEAELWETSLVTFPANDEARVMTIKTVRDFERFLRDAGFSRKESLRIASQGFVPGVQRDSGLGEKAAEIAAELQKNISLLEK